MKMMITVNQTLMLEWMRIKRSEEYGSYVNVMWKLVRNIRKAKNGLRSNTNRIYQPTSAGNLPIPARWLVFGW
jgi:hypothetical protein